MLRQLAWFWFVVMKGQMRLESAVVHLFERVIFSSLGQRSFAGLLPLHDTRVEVLLDVGARRPVRRRKLGDLRFERAFLHGGIFQLLFAALAARGRFCPPRRTLAIRGRGRIPSLGGATAVAGAVGLFASPAPAAASRARTAAALRAARAATPRAASARTSAGS